MFLLSPKLSASLYIKKMPIGAIIFDTRSAVPVSGETTIINQTLGPWNIFLNTYGVWGTNASTFDATYSLNVTVPGTYQVQLCVDNTAQVFIDGALVLSHNDWGSSVTKNVTLSSGVHPLKLNGFNEGGPMAIAVAIKFFS